MHHPPGPARATSTLHYRPDIDGLRAIAVLSVLGYHLHLASVPGGFAGVDIFFVISGYLIGSILLADLKANRFSLRNFYIRRIRRIFPALLAVLLGTFLLALVFVLPSELNDLAQSLIAAALSASNLYFAAHSNYFDINATSRPALQTWSLGVEEQFYIVFPLLLWLLYRRAPRHLAPILAGLAALSIALSVAGALYFPTVAFFMPYTRAYELLIGVLLALPLLPRTASSLLRNLLAALGLAFVLIAITRFSSAIPFPGYAALLPCIGSALLIYSGLPRGQGHPGQAHADPSPVTLTARLLALPPLVFAGLISYSLYLWHWPLIVFQQMGAFWGSEQLARLNQSLVSALIRLKVQSFSARLIPVILHQRALVQARGWARAGRRLTHFYNDFFPFAHPQYSWVSKLTVEINHTLLFLLSFVLATLTWLLIERPFREGRLRLAGTRAFWFAGVSVLVLVSCGIATLATHGFPRRFPAAAVRVAAFAGEPRDYRLGACMVTDAADFKPSICLREDPNRPNWLLIGDSHAAASWTGLARALPQVNLLQVTRPACHPDPTQTAGDCGVLMQQVFTKFLPTHHIDRILAIARWTEADKTAVIPNLLGYARAHSIPITLFGPVQEYDAPLPRLLAYSIIRHDPTLADRHRVHDWVTLDALFAGFASIQWNVQYVSLVKLLCSPSSCISVADPATGAPMLVDLDHYSTEGSILVGQKVAQQLQREGDLSYPPRPLTSPRMR